jgi:hypothetical protein
MQLDDWVLCRIYKKTNPQLMYSSLPSRDAELSMDVRGQHQDHDSVVSAAAYGRLPRPPSISDYLVDYSAVSELFESIPAPQLGTTDAGSSSSSAAAAHQFLVASNSEAATGSSLAQQSAEDYPNNTSMEMLQQHAASMAANNSLSVFGPGYPSLQDRI